MTATGPTAARVVDAVKIYGTGDAALHERTRELGPLSAAGRTRAQLRAMVRWESVLVAAFGTVLAPTGPAAGAVAGLRPARRAARLDVLRALAAE